MRSVSGNALFLGKKLLGRPENRLWHSVKKTLFSWRLGLRFRLLKNPQYLLPVSFSIPIWIISSLIPLLNHFFHETSLFIRVVEPRGAEIQSPKPP